MTEWREYELGVTDVIRHKVGLEATVEHNVKMVGRSGRKRQVDVVVRGPIFGVSNGLVAVDCKYYRRPATVRAVESFAGLLDDIGADFGILVSNAGVTKTAKARAPLLRIRLRVLGRDELDQWSPAGTRSVSFALARGDCDLARHALVRAGYRVRDQSSSWPDDDCVFEAFRLGVADDELDEFYDRVFRELGQADIKVRRIGSGVTIGGGTPLHRWINVFAAANPIPFKILAATKDDLERELEHVARSLGCAVSDLRPEPPDGWPPQDTFESDQ